MPTITRVETMQVRCTCAVSEPCRQRGCHGLTGPTHVGYLPWIPGETVCADGDAPTKEGPCPTDG
jgi:hypothetical protein